ncbi:MAG: DUF3943 domain-containing protein [Proteobacteria bacterium]|nr:MAG: DUF3943 domain-containing protein [Pseudomonadota bacterium]
MNRALRQLLILTLLLLSVLTLAADLAVASEINWKELPGVQTEPPVAKKKTGRITSREKALNFGVVYVAQWASYYATQHKVIAEHGSWENWIKHPGSPHFDKDSFDFNLVKHSFVGQYYYLFYRSRGYEERQSFYWAALSSLVFEFTIETVTEKPSFQDIYQTPVFGTILGLGTERLSDYFHSIGTLPTTMLAYILNPFTLLPYSKCQCGVAPTIGKNGEAGIVASLEF